MEYVEYLRDNFEGEFTKRVLDSAPEDLGLLK
jgi:hypothetical protein